MKILEVLSIYGETACCLLKCIDDPLPNVVYSYSLHKEVKRRGDLKTLLVSAILSYIKLLKIGTPLRSGHHLWS